MGRKFKKTITNFIVPNNNSLKFLERIQEEIKGHEDRKTRLKQIQQAAKDMSDSTKKIEKERENFRKNHPLARDILELKKVEKEKFEEIYKKFKIDSKELLDKILSLMTEVQNSATTFQNARSKIFWGSKFYLGRLDFSPVNPERPNRGERLSEDEQKEIQNIYDQIDYIIHEYGEKILLEEYEKIYNSYVMVDEIVDMFHNKRMSRKKIMQKSERFSEHEEEDEEEEEIEETLEVEEVELKEESSDDYSF